MQAHLYSHATNASNTAGQKILQWACLIYMGGEPLRRKYIKQSEIKIKACNEDKGIIHHLILRYQIMIKYLMMIRNESYIFQYIIKWKWLWNIKSYTKIYCIIHIHTSMLWYLEKYITSENNHWLYDIIKIICTWHFWYMHDIFMAHFRKYKLSKIIVLLMASISVPMVKPLRRKDNSHHTESSASSNELWSRHLHLMMFHSIRVFIICNILLFD